ncbi:MAG: sigma-70 family RNA polymerase sigma factor [Nakamurella sp.]
MDPTAGAALSTLTRDDRGRILATLIRLTGDIDVAQDALQDGVLRAIRVWPQTGVPDNPRAWVTVAARRCAVDRLRREAQRHNKEVDAMQLLGGQGAEPPASVVRDDLLRLVFTCAHPSLSADARVALCLRTLGGLTTAEVARALLVSEASMAKRLTRTKQKIAKAHIPYRVPTDAELPDRLPAVLATVYLIFNEGYAAASGPVAIRGKLLDEAIRLSRLLRELLPDEPSVMGLLALLLLQDSRRRSRVDAAGNLVLLADQQRTLWDRGKITEGVRLIGDALQRSRDRPDPYVVQAAIAACHALAPEYSATDWPAIVSWYDVLLSVSDTPVVRLNRAAAIAGRDGPGPALAELEKINGLADYPFWHASRGELLGRLDRPEEARAAFDRAIALGLNDSHAEHLRGRS